MSQQFKILVDRLKSGETLRIDETVDSHFLGIEEDELRFAVPVVIKGETYVTDTHLILHLKAATFAEMPCSVCNEMIRFELKLEDFYHAEPLAEIPSAIFDFSEILRDELLLGLPQYIECQGGQCSQRPSVAPYLKSQKRVENPTYFPFENL